MASYCACFCNPYIKRKFPPEGVLLDALQMNCILCFSFRLQKQSYYEVQSAAGCKIYLLEGFWIFVKPYPKHVITRNCAFHFSCAEKLLVICLISCQNFKILNWKKGKETKLTLQYIVTVGKAILDSVAFFYSLRISCLFFFPSWFNSSNNIDHLLLFLLFL